MSGGEWGWGGEEAGEEAGEVGEGVASWLSEVEAARRVHALAGPVVSEIRRRVRDATGGLTLSARRRTALCFSTSDECLVAPFDQAGIAPNFLLAKMGADVNKPDGQHTVSPTVEAVLAFLSATPTRKAIPPSAAHHEAAPRSCATARLYLGISATSRLYLGYTSRLHLGYISATPRGYTSATPRGYISAISRLHLAARSRSSAASPRSCFRRCSACGPAESCSRLRPRRTASSRAAGRRDIAEI